jgi:hypothetical protein
MSKSKIILLILSLPVLSCLVCWWTPILPFSSTIDISDKSPYSEAIGKKFVVKQSMYIYQADYYSKNAIISIEGLKGIAAGRMPNVVDERYIGTIAGNGTIHGVVKKGQIITISHVVIEKGFEDCYGKLRVFVDSDAYFSRHECITWPSLLNRACQDLLARASQDILYPGVNPPKTLGWGDPPIFETDLLEPLPSDGVWWK